MAPWFSASVGVVVDPTSGLTFCAAVLVFVSRSADIQSGQGLYYTTLTKSWRAKNCTVNSYGVANQTFGLTPSPCRDCESHAHTFTLPFSGDLLPATAYGIAGLLLSCKLGLPPWVQHLLFPNSGPDCVDAHVSSLPASPQAPPTW